ncbi:hypothetical protein KPH14_002474 [Odynerus spinipes]|uniref:C2H2-type domain-containing protein n=1 Tax=Odynerus spinipes TaxID=1348599 RepID=A0AAD9RSG1_9HYME|nr:hypothetical protein KPH14_002474 [Odynerus spinipes]
MLPVDSVLLSWYRPQTSGVTTSSSSSSSHPMAEYRRLSCPSCGRSYKYRSGLLGHIAECFSEKEKQAAAFQQRQIMHRQQQQRRLQMQEQQQQQQQQQEQEQQWQPVTTRDVKVLYKFWKP